MAPLPDTPDLVEETAQNWLHHGGGRDAHECLAQAELALGAYRDAAIEYETLSLPLPKPQNGHGLPPSEIARHAVFAEQAAGAWLLAGDGKAAEHATRLALVQEPTRLGLKVLLARSLSMQGHFAESIEALGALPGALAPEAPVDPFLVRALVVRATAYRYLGQNAKGMTDVNQALSLSPDDIDALLERGILSVRLAQYAQARGDWDRVIALAPDGHEAYLARQDEAILDADPDQD